MSNITNITVDQNEIGGKTIETVSARELHGFLGVGRDFSTWVKSRIIKFDMKRDTNYLIEHGNVKVSRSTRSRNRIDYHLSLEYAKRIALAENTDAGRMLDETVFVGQSLAQAKPPVADAAIIDTNPAHTVTDIALYDQTIGARSVKTINARELHGFLGVGKDFSNWIKGRVDKFGFVENQDFICSPVLASKLEGRKTNLCGGRNIKEYHLTLDMAKELAMVENNEKGREARRYFIECEKQFRTAVTTAPAAPKLPRKRSTPVNPFLPVGYTESGIDRKVRQFEAIALRRGFNPAQALDYAISKVNFTIAKDCPIGWMYDGYMPREPISALLVPPQYDPAHHITARDFNAAKDFRKELDGKYLGAEDMATELHNAGYGGFLFKTGRPNGSAANNLVIELGYGRRFVIGVVPTSKGINLSRAVPIKNKITGKLLDSGQIYYEWKMIVLYEIMELLDKRKATRSGDSSRQEDSGRQEPTVQ